jgi:hypothetical protein
MYTFLETSNEEWIRFADVETPSGLDSSANLGF